MPFEIGNKYAQEWTLENALPRFEDAYKFAYEDSSCLCLQDAIMQTGIPSRTFYQLAKNHDVLQTIKEDIHDVIISRVNRLALDKIAPVPASPAIWRMKQLGERDEQHINQNIAAKSEITVADKETLKAVEDLKAKFEGE